MKRHTPLLGILPLMMWLAASDSPAAQMAIVTGDRVNVRGQASLAGEVITQLNTGERVVILEQISSSDAGPGEPTNWFKIQMPTNTPVWVFASYIHPADKTVTVNRLNLRAGPGENYSVVGRIERGEQVKEIRTVEDWMEIATPTNAYAFVAADLLAPIPDQSAPELAREPAVPTAVPPAASPARTEQARTEQAKTEQTPATPGAQASTTSGARLPVIRIPDESQARTEQPPAITEQSTEPGTAIEREIRTTAQETEPADTQTTTIARRTETEPSFDEIRRTTADPAGVGTAGRLGSTTSTDAARHAPAEPDAESAAPPAVPPSVQPEGTQPAATEAITGSEGSTPGRRVVRREGLVRSTISIQAPTYFELVNPATRKTINYLHAGGSGFNLKNYKGDRIIVTGEEFIDPRWPRTPVIEIETLDLAP